VGLPSAIAEERRRAALFGEVVSRLVETIMLRRMVALLALVAGLSILLPGTLAAEGRYGRNYFPNLPVVTQDGKELRFYDDLIKGKIVVISFIYTNCPDICPLTTARLAQVEEKLGEIMGRDIHFISMTVDPERDTPEKLKAFSGAFQAGPGWQFVTGKPENVRAINAKLGDRSRNLSDHRNEIVVGNDVTGEWTRDNVLGDIDRVIMSIRSMDPKWRNEARTVPHVDASNTGYAFGGHPGQSMYKKVCAPCHTIGVGDRVGPDLRGITARREHDWLVSFIMDPEKLRARKDPLALALAAKYPGVRMPRLGIPKKDATDLVAYLEAETAKLTAAAEASAGQKHDHHNQHNHQGHEGHKPPDHQHHRH
jgi:cytochrome oxidase Cu insertion factor (SCO1/SenC/PrrC family)/cytochrome c2